MNATGVLLVSFLQAVPLCRSYVIQTYPFLSGKQQGCDWPVHKGTDSLMKTSTPENLIIMGKQEKNFS